MELEIDSDLGPESEVDPKLERRRDGVVMEWSRFGGRCGDGIRFGMKLVGFGDGAELEMEDGYASGIELEKSKFVMEEIRWR